MLYDVCVPCVEQPTDVGVKLLEEGAPSSIVTLDGWLMTELP